jgi:hypothetical protein
MNEIVENTTEHLLLVEEKDGELVLVLTPQLVESLGVMPGDWVTWRQMSSGWEICKSPQGFCEGLIQSQIVEL